MTARYALVAALTVGCKSDRPATHGPPASPTAPSSDAVKLDDDPFATARDQMVDATIRRRGVTDQGVIAALRKVKRHELVAEDLQSLAYEDRPLPIGFEQTISQPYIVAAMTEAAELRPGEKVLEIGTGSGYQAAVLAEMGLDVYSIEIVEPLAKRTHELLARMGYTKLHLRIGDGYKGWPESAPFDAIIVTAAPEEVPQPLLDQLAIGGRMVIPVGAPGEQDLRVISRGKDGTTSETLFPVRFVPMTGSAQARQ